MNIQMDFKGKIVLVTGASSGIGEHVSIEFAKNGAKVVLIGRNEVRLNGVVDKIKSNGSPNPLVIVADVTKDAQKIIDETIQNFDQLDVLVNNAGIVGADTTSTINLEQLDDIFATNCRAVVELTKLAVPHLVKTKGNIVNISSIAGLKPFKDATSYCMSKAALDMFTKCASLELAPKGIRVNAVNPGLIVTPILKNIGLDDAMLQDFIEQEKETYPVGRVGIVADTSNAILFVANEKSSFINGALLVVDGGKLHV